MPQVIRSFFSPITERSVGAGVPARLRRLSLRLSPHAFYRAFLPHTFYCMPFVSYFQWIRRFRWIAMQLSPHSVVMRQLQHSYWKNGEHSAPPWFLNWTHLKRAYIIPQKIKISDFFRQILLLPHPLSKKNIPPKSQSKSCTDIFPLNVRHFPQNKNRTGAKPRIPRGARKNFGNICWPATAPYSILQSFKKERWQSGRLCLTRNQVCGQPYRGFKSLSLRLKFNATSPFSVSSESGLIYETTPLFASNWLLGFNKSPSTPNVQLNCNRHLAPQLGDDILQ